jgi:hypothetical protein
MNLELLFKHATTGEYERAEFGRQLVFCRGVPDALARLGCGDWGGILTEWYGDVSEAALLANRFLKWNEIVDEVRRDVSMAVESFHQIAPSIRAAVADDVLAIGVMDRVGVHHRRLTEVKRIYECGLVVIGWDGPFPEGSLLVL